MCCHGFSRHEAAAIKIDAETIGGEMHRFMAELYPICRSLTGSAAHTLRQHLCLNRSLS